MIDQYGTTYVDNSILRAVARCDAEAIMRHVLGLTVAQDEAPALECGSAIHEVLADYLCGKDALYCRAKFELLYHGWSEEWNLSNPDHPMHRLNYNNVDKILDEWFETHPLGNFPFGVNPKLVEVGFQIPLTNECVCGAPDLNVEHKCVGPEPRPAYVFVGRLDAIVQAQHDNSLYVLDHKTTGRMSSQWSESFRSDSQMSGYVWAAQKTLGQRVVGVFINGIQLDKLPNSERKCREHGSNYAECSKLHMKSELLIFTRSPDQLDAWHATALNLARRYRSLYRSHHRAKGEEEKSLTTLLAQGTFHGACTYCTFNKFCQAGRPDQYRDTMLTYRPWKPFDLGEEKKK